ncbi:MAG: DUF1501 domain-containing protein [bacterium]|nr:DUF1501 domain-containing protein [bacterium]
MFTIADTRQGSTRRDFLRIGGLGLGGLTLPGLMELQALSASNRPNWIRNKSVVLLFLQGGPPQIETFDPKMEALSEIRSCTGEVKTNLPGVTIGGTFPKLGAMADRLSIVRSFSSGDGGHNQMPVLTGRSVSGGVMGAHYARLAGANHPETSMPSQAIVLPEQVQPNLELGEPTGPFSYGYIRKNYGAPGELGQAYEGMLLDGGDSLLSNFTMQLPRERFDDRVNLLASLDGVQRQLDRTGALDGANAFQQQAYDVLRRGISSAFDLSQEDPGTIASYDTSGLFNMKDWHRGGKHYNNLRNQSRITNLLGKQMLLARRLCEAGCGFVTVVDGCWDFHGDGNNPPTPVGMPLLGPQVDHAVSAFLSDLEERGMSDDVLLLVTGEMGRSPKKNGRNGGTGHWAGLTPLLVAGGGLNMGQVIGNTDAQGGRATTKLHLPEHLLATVMQTLFDPTEARLISGIPNEQMQMITANEPIRELFN